MENVKTITIIGAGVIGKSWTTFYLSKKFNVVVNDPFPEAEEKTLDYIKANYASLIDPEIPLEEALSNFKFTTDLKEALDGTDFVHENGPERLDFKQELYKDIDDILPADVVVASSTSGIPMSNIQEALTVNPQRFVIAHPFNPPHIMPLVEVVRGNKTDEKYLDQTQAFFDKLGKKTVRLKKELPGHVANRIAAALYKEVLWLIQEDVMSVEDVDASVSYGPGLRWGIFGPSMLYNLGGGEGGIKHFFEQFAGPLESTFAELKTPTIDQALQDKVVAGVQEKMQGSTLDELGQQRNEILGELIRSKKKLGVN
ncbi:3-hydroxyacyl-CoA dehydrogenase family protein [Sphingobacterium hungaricum]